MIFRKRYILESPLSLAQALKRVKKETAPGNLFTTGMWSGHNNIFKGKVFGDGFVITRIIWYNNSSKPIIYGQLFEEESSLKLHLKFKLHALNLTFLIFVYAAWIFFGLPVAWFFSQLPGAFLSPLMITLFLALFFLFMVWVFNLECRKARNELIRILDAEDISKKN